MGITGGATGLGAALTDLGITLANAKKAERMLKQDRENTAQIHQLVKGSLLGEITKGHIFEVNLHPLEAIYFRIMHYPIENLSH